MSYRALWKQPTLFQHVNGDERKGSLDNTGVLEQNVRTRLISRFGDSRILTDNYTRADPVDNIFKHVVTAGYMEEARRSLSLSVSFSFNESRYARKVSSILRVNAKLTMIIRVIR